MFFLIGPKRSGKGTIARVLNALIGPENVAAPTLSSLPGRFGLWSLIGKPLAIIGDARLSGRSDSTVIVERLLSITGNDSQSIERKNLSDWNGYLPTRFLLISNELPRLADASGAFPSRVILLRLTRSFYGQEDINLTARLLGELPGILRWAIAGWQRLQARGKFLQPASGAKLLDDLNDLSSPVGTFVRECCRTGPNCEVPIKDLFAAWKKWCEEHGRDHPGDSQGFGRNIRACVPDLDSRQLNDQGKRTRVYAGIELIPEVSAF